MSKQNTPPSAPDRCCGRCKYAGPVAYDDTVRCDWPEKHLPPWFASFVLSGSMSSRWQEALAHTNCPCFEPLTKHDTESALADEDKAALDALGTSEGLVAKLTGNEQKG